MPSSGSKGSTLNPTYLYLDSMPSYNQASKESYLEQVQKIGVNLRDKCNTGDVYGDGKGNIRGILDLFST